MESNHPFEHKYHQFFLLSLFFFWCLAPLDARNLQTYIVQLHPHDMVTSLFETKLHWHLSFLEKTVLLEEEDPSSRLLYSYHTALEGFSARLTDDEAFACPGSKRQRRPSVRLGEIGDQPAAIPNESHIRRVKHWRLSSDHPKPRVHPLKEPAKHPSKTRPLTTLAPDGNFLDASAAMDERVLLPVDENLDPLAAGLRRGSIELHTTYSYKFLGLNFAPDGAWAKSGFGQGTIIGVLDTGVWPENPSFDDRRMPPVPRRWRGACQEGESFNSSNCNRKLIGARFYSKGHRANMPAKSASASPLEYVSARDAHGHGTHTASTAAGALVPDASVLGVGAGEARGTAPGAHIAVYKVCWFNGCYSSDILGGMDDAIRDGVDVLSLSLGGFPIPLFEDSIAIGSFRAMEKGVIVICAAGNNGPVPSSVANEAPWITTVGASTLDRRFPAFVRMDNGQILYGESMYPGNLFLKKSGKQLELVYDTGGRKGDEFCIKGSLSKSRVGGKMVVCDRGISGRAEKGLESPASSKVKRQEASRSRRIFFQ